ncbi:MAG: LacI family DNA-binding transcriptional regulator, partial [Anaeroplasmataceae bacterium]|nr:LacI family DNA-binding transcriptional regulator [Anaeroplasmataceae bacterium]
MTKFCLTNHDLCHIIKEKRYLGVNMKKAITIKSIAEALNLSRNTVSKALNGQYVPEKTRELVLSKAQELNYKSLSSAN